MDDHSDIGNLDSKSSKDFADELTKIACRQLQASNKYKQPLLEKWKNFENLKAGIVKKKLRVQFNVPLPVFSGMLDTLESDFDEPVELEFQKKHPADYFKVKRVQAAWNIEKNSFERTARWDYKSRIDLGVNIVYGRSILKSYAESDPKYRNVLSNTHPVYFHNQPLGGGLLENHLYAGEEGIIRTEGEIDLGVQDGLYDKRQFGELKHKSQSSDYIQEVSDYHREKLARFMAAGLDPDQENYVGERTFNLCEWVMTYKGKRYYLLFDPWTVTWLRCERLKDIYSKDLMPWTSWASFADDRLFWTPAYADFIYPVADSIVTLFNQELTNREKRNMGARAYDKDMFTDVAKLNSAQYRADALVPVDTKGGTRKIGDGIYYFETPELQGTINLLDWTDKQLQKESGVTDISQGVAMNASKKVNVAYMEQSNIAKRLGHKSQSKTECWGEIGVRFVQGLQDHMTGKMAIEVLGELGIEPDVLSRDDLDLKGEIAVQVISSTARKAESEKKRQGKIKALEMTAQSQNINSEMRDAAILRYIGEFEEDEIKLFLDTKNYASRESVAKAHIVIHELMAGIIPELNYAADRIFLKVIYDYMLEHRSKLGVEKVQRFATYLAHHAELAMKNGQRAGTARGMITARTQMQQNGPPEPTGAPAPAAGTPGAPAVAEPSPVAVGAPAQPEVAQAGIM